MDHDSTEALDRLLDRATSSALKTLAAEVDVDDRWRELQRDVGEGEPPPSASGECG
ncbi:hypothetical protein [Actinoplanes friuliensis]|uniref:hypothetical protein n=1 Tax=Actinoplanes friuliensis TaxID=196914 RepID=UPI000415B156|nr:hypothetical protein [Actinoplanes friuliensis]